MKKIFLLVQVLILMLLIPYAQAEGLYSSEQILDVDISTLTNEKIEELLSNISQSDPLKTPGGYMWVPKDINFFGHKIMIIWAEIEKDGKFNPITYAFTRRRYESYDGFDVDIELFEAIVNTVKERLDKTGYYMINGVVYNTPIISDEIKAQIISTLKSNDYLLLAYPFDDKYAIVLNATNKESTVALFAANGLYNYQ